MKAETRAELSRINAQFYAKSAADFVQTRTRPWPGWSALLPHLPHLQHLPNEPGRVLDLGSGDGRFGRWLRELRPDLAYLGIDQSPALLARAAPLPGLLGDVWALEALLPPGDRFAVILALGLLHHLPGRAERLAWLASLKDRLAPTGRLILSFWDVEAAIRGRNRLADPSQHGLDPSDLEPGDHLVFWGQAKASLRYCHHASEAEITEVIAAMAPLQLRARFRADGRAPGLNRYLIFEQHTLWL